MIEREIAVRAGAKAVLVGEALEIEKREAAALTNALRSRLLPQHCARDCLLGDRMVERVRQDSCKCRRSTADIPFLHYDVRLAQLTERRDRLGRRGAYRGELSQRNEDSDCTRDTNAPICHGVSFKPLLPGV